MDANQTRFHLILGKSDWLPAAGPGVTAPQGLPLEWNEADATLILRRRPFLFPPPRGKPPLDVETRRGAGRDLYGNWYWIAENHSELLFLGCEQKEPAHFWSAEDEIRRCSDAPAAGGNFQAVLPLTSRELRLAGLAVTLDHFLVVGLTMPKGLLLFDLHGGGPPLQFHWPDAVDFVPFDLAPAPDGGVWILDRKNKRYWGLDRMFRVRSLKGWTAPGAPMESAFQPSAGPQFLMPRCVEPVRITAELAAPLDVDAVADPVALEALPDGSVLILDNPSGVSYSRVFRYQLDRAVGSSVSFDRSVQKPNQSPPPMESPAPRDLRGHDLAFVPAPNRPSDEVAGTLFIAEREGEQSFAFELTATMDSFELTPNRQYFPMRLFGGKALVSAFGQAHYDSENRWVSLAEQPMPRFEGSATYCLPAARSLRPEDSNAPFFDGKQPGCVWHRLLLDACIPPGAEVRVESRTADSRRLLPDAPWQPEPSLYHRGDGAEVPFYKVPLRGPADHTGTWELLFQHAVGRYLQLRLTLRGTGTSSPRLQCLRVYYPRFSYLHEYLPAAYRDDAISASFLDRYLANTEGFFTALEGKIERTPALFDTRTVPDEYMEWLAGWLGLSLDLSWNASKRRLFLRHAPQVFLERGTPRGLESAIRLTLEECPEDSLFTETLCDSTAGRKYARSRRAFSVRIVERFLTRRAPGVLFGDPTDLLGPGSTTEALAWTPAQGAGPLHERFRGYLRRVYSTIEALNAAWSASFSGFDDPNLRLPAIAPQNKVQAQDWRLFLAGRLGFTYAAVTTEDAPLFRSFLEARYATIAGLNSAYRLTATDAHRSFSGVRLPDALPSAGQALQDWIEFVSIVLPTRRNAHRFSVLVPVTLRDTTEMQIQKVEVARRIAELEKPAHTSFDVKPYWAMFRVGEARLGLDTLLGRGSRFVALVLGRGSLAGGHLAFTEPWNVQNRMVLGQFLNAPSCRTKQPHERCL